MLRQKAFGLTVILIAAGTSVQNALAAQGTPWTDRTAPKQWVKATPARVVKEAQSNLIIESGKTAKHYEQTEARRLQEATLRAQQAQARYAEENKQLAQEQARQSQAVAKANVAKTRQADEEERIKNEALRKAHQREVEALQQSADAELVADQKSNQKNDEVDTGELQFKNAKAEILWGAFFGPRKISSRDALPPINVKGISPQKAFAPPYVIKAATGGDRRQVQKFQANLQSTLFALPSTQTPIAFSDIKMKQTEGFFNNYPAFVNQESISIDKKNTYKREVTATQYPIWYERSTGWTYCSGFVLGSSVQVGPDWFGWDWPDMLGPAPKGFICQPDYFPTPWVYLPYKDKWRASGESSYKRGPDQSYTGPISVEMIEPVTAKIPDQFGVPVFQTINVVYFYNAFYNPEFDRWGFVNNKGSWVWLNI